MGTDKAVGDAPTASRPELLVDGSDERLRKLVYDLFTVADRLAVIRRHLGGWLDITGPQFNLLTAIRQIAGEVGVTVGDVASHLHITPPFVVAESRKLEQKGLLERHPDEQDGRVTRLRLSPEGVSALNGIAEEMQHINDLFFDVRSADEFTQLCANVDRLVDGSSRAIGYVATHEQAAKLHRWTRG